MLSGILTGLHATKTIHPLVHIEQMDKHQQKEAAEQIEQTIRIAL